MTGGLEMGPPCLIYDDPRPIESIAGEVGCWSTASGLRIVAYKEHGQGDYVPYYAVCRGDAVLVRVPASLVVVQYADDPR